jgi:hypothetical protein
MISPLRQLRLDASIILLLIVGVCATGGFFFAFYETEETARPIATVRHRPRDADAMKPITPAENKTVQADAGANSALPQTTAPNDKAREQENAGARENR